MMYAHIRNVVIQHRRALAIAISLAFVASCPALCRATPLAAEPFNYAPGFLVGNGGTGFTGGWSGGLFQVQAGSLSVSGYQGSGNSVALTNASSGPTTRTLNATYGTDGTDVWASFLQRIDTATAGTISFSGIRFGANTSYVFVGLPSASVSTSTPVTTWGMDGSNGDTKALSQKAAINSQTALLVAHFKFTSVNDAVDLFVNPSLGSVPTVADATYTIPAFFLYSFSQIQIYNNGVTGAIDEFRMGTTFADVVPEPPAIWLGLLGSSIAIFLLQRGVKAR